MTSFGKLRLSGLRDVAGVASPKCPQIPTTACSISSPICWLRIWPLKRERISRNQKRRKGQCLARHAPLILNSTIRNGVKIQHQPSSAQLAHKQGFQQSEQSAFDSGAHWQRPEQNGLGPIRSPWVWKPPTRRANALQIKLVEVVSRRVCSMCGERFIPIRCDAKTCSSACRQKAYRMRAMEAQQ